MTDLKHFFARADWRKLVRQWELEEISETVFCIRAATILGMTEGEVRDMIDAFEV